MHSGFGALLPPPPNPGSHRHDARERFAFPEFAEHDVQVAGDDAPVCTEYLPALQSVHTVQDTAPGVSEYVPAGQSVHASGDQAPGIADQVPAQHEIHVAMDVAAGSVE